MRHTRSATRRLAEKASDRAAHQNTEPDTPCHRAKENIPDNEKQRKKRESRRKQETNDTTNLRHQPGPLLTTYKYKEMKSHQALTMAPEQPQAGKRIKSLASTRPSRTGKLTTGAQEGGAIKAIIQATYTRTARSKAPPRTWRAHNGNLIFYPPAVS